MRYTPLILFFCGYLREARKISGPHLKKFYEGQSQFFYEDRLLRRFLCILNVFLGYFGSY